MQRALQLLIGLTLLSLPAMVAAQGLQNVQDAAGKAKKGEKFPVTTLFFVQHRQLAVADQDPLNEQLTIYALRAQGRLTKDLSVFMTGGLFQRYVAEQDESPFRLIDSRVGVAWRTPVDLGGSKKLGVLNELSVFLPTSRNSQLQDLIAAPQARVQFMFQPIKGMTLALSPRFRYHFHRYAERAGQEAVMNVRINTGLRGGLDYGLLNFGKAGRVGIGASAGTAYVRKYDSREKYASENSDQGVWLQFYDWEAHLTYGVAMLNFAVSIEQGAGVLRNGVVNVNAFDQEETELVFSAFAMF